MGALLDCLKPKEDPLKPEPVTQYSSTSERTPLLAHIPRAQPTSARVQQRPEILDSGQDEEPNLEPIEIQTLGISDVDKQFKDHAGLYNDYLSRYVELQTCMTSLGGNKLTKYKGVQTTMQNIRSEMSTEGWNHLKLNRRYKHCMEIKYQGQTLNENALLAFQAFNRANHLVKELFDKKKPLIDSVSLVIESEEKIKRDVFVHCTDSQHQGQGAEFWKISLGNMKKLRRVRPCVEYMSKETSLFFDEMVLGAGILCSERNEIV